MLTIDANVFIGAASPTVKSHRDSDLFLSRVRRDNLLVRCPALLLPEVASGIIRPTGNIVVTQLTVLGVENFPQMHWVELTQTRAEAAVQIALTCRLRGADAVYVAVAQEYGTTLVTWDAKVLARGTQAVSVMTPTDWLAANPI